MQRPTVQLLLRCDRRGRVLAVLRGEALAPGMTLAGLVADAGAAPLLDFLVSLARSGAAVSGELAAANGRALSLAGVAAGDGALVAGDTDAAGLARFSRLLLATPVACGEPAPEALALAELARLLDAAGPGGEPAEGRSAVDDLRRRLAEQQEEIGRLKAELARRKKRSAS